MYGCGDACLLRSASLARVKLGDIEKVDFGRRSGNDDDEVRSLNLVCTLRSVRCEHVNDAISLVMAMGFAYREKRY